MEKAKILRSAGLVGGFTMLSRMLGLARDILMAGLFGTSLAMSAFWVAFTIPNLFRRLFGEGALSSAFIPVFVESREKEGSAAAWRLARKVISLAVMVLTIIVVIGVLGISIWIELPVGDKTAMVLPLLRIMLPYMLFICLVALSMAILNSFHHFAMPAGTPCILNLIWIAALVFWVPRVPEAQRITVVAWAILIAGVVQLLAQFPVLRKFGFRPGWELDTKDPRVSRVLKLMGPAAAGLAVTQINVMVDRLLAMWVGSYATSALVFSERLIYLPLGIFATALGTVLLPVFSRQAARDELDRFEETIQSSLRNLFFVMIPASVGLLVLAKPIVQMIFEWRAFGTASTAYTASALQFYAPGLLVFSLAKVMVPAFYARQDTLTPVKVGLFTVGLNFALNITFILTWPQELKHAGLACATVISEAVYGITLAILLKRRGIPWHLKKLGGTLLRCAIASALMGAVAFIGHPILQDLFTNAGWTTKVIQIASTLTAVVVAILVYFVISALLRSPELNEVVGALRRRVKG